MPLSVLASYSEPGSPTKTNEDVVGHAGNAAWVLDGATGLGKRRFLPGDSDAAWLAGRYDTLLRETLLREAPPGEPTDDSPDSLKRLIGNIIGQVAGLFAAEASWEAEEAPEKKAQEEDGEPEKGPPKRHELPSAGIALVRCTPDRLDMTSLGDCRAIVALPDGRVASTKDSPLTALDAGVVASMRSLLESGRVETPEKALAAVRPQLRDNRARLNTEGGYWVLSVHPEAAGRMEVQSFPLRRGDMVRGLLVSDGFYRLVDTFRVFRDDAELLEQAFASEPDKALKGMLHRLRAIEDGDSECVDHLRLKAKDDATALAFKASL